MNSGFGLCGQFVAVSSSERRCWHWGWLFALPIKASLLGTDQFRFFLASISLLKSLSYATQFTASYACAVLSGKHSGNPSVAFEPRMDVLSLRSWSVAGECRCHRPGRRHQARYQPRALQSPQTPERPPLEVMWRWGCMAPVCGGPPWC